VVPKLSVFVVDHHEVVRWGVTHLLNETDDLRVTGQASTAAQALARVPAQRPDLAVLAVHLPDGHGVDLCRQLRSRLPDLQCLMLTSDTDETVMMDAFLAGAGGFVVKDISGVDLVAAIRTVGSGRALLDRRAAAALFGRLRSAAPPPGPLAGLTEQEHTTLELIGLGLSNRQIAGRMFVAEKTVKNYVSHVLAKLGMTSRTQVAVLAATEATTSQARA
jgi:two-component system, NarL family, response regulator DevR